MVGVVARGRDLPPELRGGGLEAGYVSMLTRSRQDAVARAVEMAESAGADAVLGLRFDCSEITQNLSEVIAYGTAVKLVPLPGEERRSRLGSHTGQRRVGVGAHGAARAGVGGATGPGSSAGQGPPQGPPTGWRHPESLTGAREVGTALGENDA